jgi:hypothetical protein
MDTPGIGRRGFPSSDRRSEFRSTRTTPHKQGGARDASGCWIDGTTSARAARRNMRSTSWQAALAAAMSAMCASMTARSGLPSCWRRLERRTTEKNLPHSRLLSVSNECFEKLASGPRVRQGLFYSAVLIFILRQALRFWRILSSFREKRRLVVPRRRGGRPLRWRIWPRE